jgi:hypothetical protein
VLGCLLASSPRETTTATAFDVSSEGLHVTYTTAGTDGQPHLTFVSAAWNLSFAGDQIRTVPSTDVGTLVSVTIRRTVDSGATSFTLIVPRVILAAPDGEANVELVGITTTHRFSVVRRFNRGQLDGYSEVRLTGTARAGVATQ